MPWREVTLVPFKSRASPSQVGVVDSAVSDAEIISDHRDAGDSRVEENLFGQSDSDQDLGCGSLHGEDFPGWEIGESPTEHRPHIDSFSDFEAASVNPEVAERVEPTVSSSSFHYMVNHSFFSSVPLHNIEMPWE